ncbi:MAG TPA: GntR family transcriptional regulator [Bosea sp. (in: a-proteobacteria)]|jgi:DNA-binding GntR family transcriptional regulator|uniref:GntR family transcriptional regulator n=1 Tax=Bosea sp. (in: a-proteobacteria) TaxID=1871050 RepID=UPI002E15DBDB|nr:GntR family transcriptional regulator [Bosea sp. (in: a-proteobacteria)]
MPFPDPTVNDFPDADQDAAPAGPRRFVIERQTLHDRIVARIRDMIAQGEFEPGARIHEVRLGEVLEISRTPLREALKYLASEGLLELVPHRGAIVRKLTRKDAHDMLSVLAVLEPLAGQLACDRASDAQIAEVKTIHDRMVAHFELNERLQYFNANQAIHSHIVKLSDNQTLIATHRSLQSQLKRVRFMGSDNPAEWQEALAEHEAIIAHLCARRKDELSDILRRHIENSWDRFKSHV